MQLQIFKTTKINQKYGTDFYCKTGYNSNIRTQRSTPRLLSTKFKKIGEEKDRRRRR